MTYGTSTPRGFAQRHAQLRDEQRAPARVDDVGVGVHGPVERVGYDVQHNPAPPSPTAAAYPPRTEPPGS
ncbi:hypothetical protein GCM10010170_074480 [Dactylosporangium salmoneum]|uniref:Uncharacterized protein n=1 Tax=Dactylosporangium salmoneum TaxID=53361 RepID=A0ABN3H9F5_9ACTN